MPCLDEAASPVAVSKGIAADVFFGGGAGDGCSMSGRLMPVVLEQRGAGGVQVDVCWESCEGIGRKCAFYNGFTGVCLQKT